ncbi:MAG: GNAT family N-acetyltransferase [Pelagibacterales bacterium]|nr:GNAT family N-acetyltransferase [Pelagibacterales bacterium]
MKDKIEIRKYRPQDARELANIYYHTIHNINIADYSEEQINAWAPESCLELDGWERKWEKLSPIVATIGDQIVGFAEFEDNGHIDCFYVHHQFQGKAVGSALIKEIFNQALRKNLSKIFAEVSITAKSFFLKNGFEVAKEQFVKIRGVELRNFVMEKILS